MVERERAGARRGGRREGPRPAPNRVDARRLVNPLLRQPALSADRVEAVHDTALRVIEELGIRVLNEEARSLFRAAGARVDDATMMVHIDRALIADSLAQAPSLFDLHGGNPSRHVTLGGDHVAFTCVGGPPYVSDRERGRRPGTIADVREIVSLNQHFDVIHLQNPSVEPQDVPVQLRHYALTEAMLTLSDKPLFVYSRGTGQVEDAFAMIRIARGLDEAAFVAQPWCYTVVNTNSPRQIDVPMGQGIIDFARAGQAVIITPFTLAGAMAPVTVTGALVLQHAEALAGICLAQIVRPGAPVVYGSFLSNVDMRTGAPAFGTPEFVQGAFAAGQMARHIGLPWRGSAATASNAPDEQAVYETAMSAWGSLLGGVNLLVHAAGWLEGGLTASLEKYIIDVEMLRIFAEIFQPLAADEAALAFEAIAEVPPGGHFFGAAHTMARYQDAFYSPILADWSNFGAWREAGGKTAVERATTIWKETLQAFAPPTLDPARAEALRDFVARRTAEGGAPPPG